jgi:decaprenylphospho-beta-D-ribofuranose 2-oxidase
MLLRHLAVSRRASANPTLSRLERPGRGLLEPPDGHVALACEIARHPRAEGLFAVLERTVLAHDGRVTLTSDIAPTRAGFERTYPEARRFAEVRRALDPQGVLSSDLACRLGLDRV